MPLSPVPGQFSRPKFTAPVLPTPPSIFGAPEAVTEKQPALPEVAIKLPAIVANPFATVQVGLAQERSKAQANAQTAMRQKLDQVSLPAAVPATITPDPAAMAAWQSRTTNLLAQSDSTVDEFGESRG